MSLNIGVADVTLQDDLSVDVLVGVSATGFTPSIDYAGAVSTSGVPNPDATTIEGTVGSGAGDETLVNLGTGLSMDDLPVEVLVTAALDDGTQEQVRVELSAEDPQPGIPDDPDNGDDGDDGFSGRDIALGAVAVGGVAFGISRFNRFRRGVE